MSIVKKKAKKSVKTKESSAHAEDNGALPIPLSVDHTFMEAAAHCFSANEKAFQDGRHSDILTDDEIAARIRATFSAWKGNKNTVLLMRHAYVRGKNKHFQGFSCKYGRDENGDLLRSVVTVRHRKVK